MASKSDLAGLLIAALFLAAGLGGCSKKRAAPAQATREPDRVTVYAVNYPLAYFAERMAPEKTEVHLPVPQDTDPAFWRPSADTIAQYQSADLILLNGAGDARWTRYATLPPSRTVVTAAGCRDTFLPSGEALSHRHGPEGEHRHGATAFETWLDPTLATCQASRVRDALIALRPDDAGAIQEAFEGLERDLKAIDRRLRNAAAAFGEQPLLASHPVYPYLADAYGLRIESLHFEPHEALGPSELEALDGLRAEHPAEVMLWEAAPLAATEEQLTRRGLTVVVFDPASQRPAEGDFIDVMSSNGQRLGCAAGSEPCP